MAIPNIPDLNELVKDVTKTFDDNFESRQELEEMRTRRHEIDTTSPFKLPHLIRPIAFIWAMGLQTILSIITLSMAFYTSPIDTTAVLAVTGSNTSILLAIVGFYFNSRKAEKIDAKRVMAAMEIDKDRNNLELKRDKVALELERDLNKIEIKSEKKEARLTRRQKRRELR